MTAYITSPLGQWVVVGLVLLATYLLWTIFPPDVPPDAAPNP